MIIRVPEKYNTSPRENNISVIGDLQPININEVPGKTKMKRRTLQSKNYFGNVTLLETFLMLKMFEGGIWSEKLLINRDIRKLNLRLILNSEERRNTLR